MPDCRERVCGDDDGCGGACTDCRAGRVCVDDVTGDYCAVEPGENCNALVEPCTPGFFCASGSCQPE